MNTEIDDFDVKEINEELVLPLTLRERLDSETLDNITEVLEHNDCLVELSWQPRGSSYRTESASVVIETCLLTAKAMLQPELSEHVHDNGVVTELAEQLRQEVAKLVPDDLRVDVEHPVWEDDRWAFLFRIVPQADVLMEATDDEDAGDWKDYAAPLEAGELYRALRDHGFQFYFEKEDPSKPILWKSGPEHVAYVTLQPGRFDGVLVKIGTMVRRLHNDQVIQFLRRSGFIAHQEAMDDDEDFKSALEPEDKNDRVRLLFQNKGLHILRINEEPQAPEWGDLGHPQRIVVSAIQPTTDKPWTTTGHSPPDMTDFLIEIKHRIGDIMGINPQLVDWTSRWREQPGHWEITWFIGDPEIRDKRVIEAVDDDDEGFKDVVGDPETPEIAANVRTVLKDMGVKGKVGLANYGYGMANTYVVARIEAGLGQPPCSSSAIKDAIRAVPGVGSVALTIIGPKWIFTIYSRASLSETVEDEDDFKEVTGGTRSERRAQDAVEVLTKQGFKDVQQHPGPGYTVVDCDMHKGHTKDTVVRLLMDTIPDTGRISSGFKGLKWWFTFWDDIVAEVVVESSDDLDLADILSSPVPVYAYSFKSDGGVEWVAPDGGASPTPVAYTVAQAKELRMAPEWSNVRWTSNPIRSYWGDNSIAEASDEMELGEILPEPQVTRDDVERALAELGMIGILVRRDEDNKVRFTYKWQPGQDLTDVGVMLIRALSQIGIRAFERRPDKTVNNLVGMFYDPTSGEGYITVRPEVLNESHDDDVAALVEAAIDGNEITAAEISKEAAQADENPTDGQKEAGNYVKGHIQLYGWDISIENAKGSERCGKNKEGEEWSVTMPAHYGYICGTEGKDKDHIDVYIGEQPDSEKVFVVNQKHEEGGFDEHKIMLCFKNKYRAVRCYDKAFSDGLGKKLREEVIETTVEGLRDWLESGDTKKPFKKADSVVQEGFVAWHSSPYRFRKFDTSKEGAHFGTREQADNLRKAGKLASKAYVLEIQNPLRIRDIGVWTIDGIATELHRQDIINEAEADAIYDERNWSDERGFAKIKEILGQKGYDGFIYQNEQEGPGDSFVAFYSRQIKPYRGMVEGMDDDADDDSKDVLGYRMTEENIMDVLARAGLYGIRASDYKPYYRQYSGVWLPGRECLMCAEHFSTALVKELGIEPSDMALTYDMETGETSVMVRRKVYEVKPPTDRPQTGSLEND